MFGWEQRIRMSNRLILRSGFVPPPTPIGAPMPMTAVQPPRRDRSPDPQRIPPVASTPTTPIRSHSTAGPQEPPPTSWAPLEWIQQLYTNAVDFCESSFYLIATTSPERPAPLPFWRTVVAWLPALLTTRFPGFLQPPQDSTQHRRADVNLALMYYSFQLYISEVVEALESEQRVLLEGVPHRNPEKAVPPDSSSPHVALYACLLDTNPAVPWMIYLITLQLWRRVQTMVQAEAFNFFQHHGDFDAAQTELLARHQCRLVPTDHTHGPLPAPVDPPTRAELAQRVAQIPQRLSGAFPFATRLQRLLRESPLAEELLGSINRITPSNGVQSAECIPFVSLFTTINSEGNPSLEVGGTIHEIFHRVMIEQWLLGEFTEWSRVSKNAFDAAFREVRLALAVFQALTQTVAHPVAVTAEGHVERTTAGFFHFLYQLRSASAEQRQVLSTLAAAKNTRELRKQWLQLTKTP